ncbi:HAD family hydrolase [Montanilutibacter psychrotolerans]
MRARPKLVLFDFDGVLVRYSHERRVEHLADATGCSPLRVVEALFDSGLETEYDCGQVDTAQYLARLGRDLESPVDEATWIASRVAGYHVEAGVADRVLVASRRARVGVLTNNGALLPEAARRVLPALFPMLEGAVLCSGALGVRKPEPEIFRRALAHFGAIAQETLFVDDSPRNVEGARSAGLHAEHTPDAATLASVLQLYDLA